MKADNALPTQNNVQKPLVTKQVASLPEESYTALQIDTKEEKAGNSCVIICGNVTTDFGVELNNIPPFKKFSSHFSFDFLSFCM